MPMAQVELAGRAVERLYDYGAMGAVLAALLLLMFWLTYLIVPRLLDRYAKDAEWLRGQIEKREADCKEEMKGLRQEVSVALGSKLDKVADALLALGEKVNRKG
jgi:hypothetical protein